MNIAKKIQSIFEAATGLQLVYGTEEAINRAIGSAQLPCGLLKLMGTSNITTDGGLLTEEPRLSVAVVNLTQFDIDSYDNEDIIADCKAKLENFLLALMASRDLTLEAVTEVSRLYDRNDDIVTGIYATFRLREVVGVACPDGSAPVREIKITDNGTYNVEPYAVAIVDVQGGSPAVIEPLSVTPDYDPHTFNPPAGVDGFAPVEVAACPACPVPDVRPLSVVPSRNAQTFSPMGFDGFAPVEVQGYTPVLQSKNATPATTAQVVTADDGYDGLSSVTVDAVTASIDPNIQAGNIKKNVQILGVTGTLNDDDFVKWWLADSCSITNRDGRTVPPFNHDIVDSWGVCSTLAYMVFNFDQDFEHDIILPNVTSVGISPFRAKGGTSKVIKGTVDLSGLTELTQTNLGYGLFAQSTYGVLAYGLKLGVLTTFAADASLGGTLQRLMRFISVGTGTAVDLHFRYWSPTYVIAEGQDAIDELNYNITHYLADKVADRTGLAALTITFGASLYNVLTPATIAAFTAKNWSVASA